MPRTDAEYQALGRIRANRRHHPDKPELIEEDRRLIRELKLTRHIQALVDAWPPLTNEQRVRLAALLAPVDAEDDAA